MVKRRRQAGTDLAPIMDELGVALLVSLVGVAGSAVTSQDKDSVDRFDAELLHGASRLGNDETPGQWLGGMRLEEKTSLTPRSTVSDDLTDSTAV